MSKRRDPFANFERMRRDVNELFEDVFTRAGLAPRQRAGFRPRVDVYYCDGPPRAIVKADLAGVSIDAVNLEVKGRTLVISGKRRLRESEGRVYQQIEIEHGPFIREIELTTDVDAERARATYEEGILHIEIPIATSEQRTHQVPVSGAQKKGLEGQEDGTEQ
jgi:HSP20 family protein